jgi:MFS family permease
MTSNGTDVAPENRPTLDTPKREQASDDKAGNSLKRATRWVALAGLVAGLVAFGLGEAVYELIPTGREGVNTMGLILQLPTQRTTNLADTRNAALAFGLLGACLAGGLGIAGGLARRSASAMLAAGLLGAILGLACGAGCSFAVLPLFFRIAPLYSEYDLIFSMIMHGSIWGAAGAAAGLAFAVGLGERRLVGRSLLAGFVGAVLGAIVFDVVGVLVYPIGTTGQPISTTWPTRLMARLMVTLATTGVVILLLPAKKPEAPRAWTLTEASDSQRARRSLDDMPGWKNGQRAEQRESGRSP